MVAALRQARGVDAADLMPRGSVGRIADIVFPTQRLIVEVKSLTIDRRGLPKVKERLGRIMDEGIKYGGPIIFGTVHVSLDQLPPKQGSRMLREIGDRVQKEVSTANKQISATAQKLSWSDYRGAIAFVSRGDIMRRDVIGWLANDALRPGKYPSVNCVIIANTDFLSTPGGRSDSYLSFHSREGFDIDVALKKRIGAAWARLHGQSWAILSPDDFAKTQWGGTPPHA
jgi:hypothetical protein